MIVVPQSTFEFIPDSEEREMTFVQDKIEEKMLILEQMKEEDPDGKNMITRQAERCRTCRQCFKETHRQR